MTVAIYNVIKTNSSLFKYYFMLILRSVHLAGCLSDTEENTSRS